MESYRTYDPISSTTVRGKIEMKEELQTKRELTNISMNYMHESYLNLNSIKLEKRESGKFEH